MEIKIVSFSELSTDELYALLMLRAKVFVVEQDCAYQDLDDMDKNAKHLLAFEGENLIGYARLLNPGDYYKEAAIGRVVTDPEVRGKGIGKALFQEALNEAQNRFPNAGVRIMAQCYLTKFYKEFGFVVDSEEFLEDGIPHVEMRLT